MVRQEGVGGAAGAEMVLNCVWHHICTYLRSFAASTHLVGAEPAAPTSPRPGGGLQEQLYSLGAGAAGTKILLNCIWHHICA